MSKTAYDTACEFFAEDDFLPWEPDKLEVELADEFEALSKGAQATTAFRRRGFKW